MTQQSTKDTIWTDLLVAHGKWICHQRNPLKLQIMSVCWLS